MDRADPAPPGGDRDPGSGAPGWARTRRSVLRDAAGVGLATGAYGLSFGALGVAGGLSAAQTCATSVLMFTGASQFALVGVLAAGGGAVSAVSTAALLGVRNAFYGLRMAPLLGVRGPARALAAHLTIDESTAMALGRDEHLFGGRASRLAFWATGLAVFVCWNLATLAGALGAAALGDPRVLGLDAAIPAGFLALLWPRLRGRTAWTAAAAAVALALVLVPVTVPGVPVLAAAGVALVAGARTGRTLRDAVDPDVGGTTGARGAGGPEPGRSGGEDRGHRRTPEEGQ